VALAISRADAVRSVTIASAAGQRTVPQQLAPVALGCAATKHQPLVRDTEFGFGATLPALTGVGPVTTLPGTPAVRIADGPADTLCVAHGDAPFTARTCAIVAPTLQKLVSVLDDERDPHAVTYVLPARVAMLRLARAKGKDVLSIPTVVADGYAGRYSGHVRFATVSTSRYDELPWVELRDAAGVRLYGQYEDRDGPYSVGRKPAAARRIAGRAGAPSLWQRPLPHDNPEALPQTCLTLTAGPPPAADKPCTTRDDPTLLLDAPCRTRRLTAAIAVRSGTTVRAEIDSAPPRRVPLRRGIALMTLRPTSTLRALAFTRIGITDLPGCTRGRLHRCFDRFGMAGIGIDTPVS
jgi:hypothetical protein